MSVSVTRNYQTKTKPEKAKMTCKYWSKTKLETKKKTLKPHVKTSSSFLQKNFDTTPRFIA